MALIGEIWRSGEPTPNADDIPNSILL